MTTPNSISIYTTLTDVTPRLHNHIQFPSLEPDATGIVSECVNFSRNRDRPLAAQGEPCPAMPAAPVQPATHTHPARQSDWSGRFDPTSPNLTSRLNPPSAPRPR